MHPFALHIHPHYKRMGAEGLLVPRTPTGAAAFQSPHRLLWLRAPCAWKVGSSESARKAGSLNRARENLTQVSPQSLILVASWL